MIRRSQFTNTTTVLMSLAMLASFSACSSKKDSPTVLAVQQTPANVVRPTGEKADAIAAQLTLSKAEILNKTYLYGASLQTSSLIQDSISTALLAISIGEMPAKFKIVGSSLQLSADQSINFESDVNHPDRLIHEFPIISQDDKNIVIKVSKGSPVLGTLLTGPQAPADRTNWLRSIEFVRENNLLMMETSIEDTTGSIAEFMETLVPRDKIVPANFKPIYNDASLNDNADRYRFLDAGAVFVSSPDDAKVRIQTKVANRYLLKSDKDVIKWYVTENIPDQYLADVGNAIEAWNRYSQKMWGRDFVKFEGRVPHGTKIGDPRFNIVVWDTVQDAGAAYESQGADPTTGIQTHSLIYLPLAWVNIGKEYWKNGKFSQLESREEKAAQLSKFFTGKSFMGRALPIQCVQDALMKVSLSAKTDEESFARELLKGVLFHEVGHAMGLAHNFKGSLAFDPDDAKGIFTTSIMDYNDYNEETASFDSLDSAKGPLLEYDRQIISVLYNDGKDVASTDPVLPACADEEADSKIGGVDPLCVRYDIGKDPTLQVKRMIELLQNPGAKNSMLQSLPNAIMATSNELGDASEVVKAEDAEAAISALADSATGIITMYIAGTANSLGYKASQIAKTLYVYRPGTLLKGYDAEALRSNTLDSIKVIAAMEKLPAASAASLDALIAAARNWLKQTTVFKKIPDSKEKDDAVEAALAPLKKVNKTVESTLLSSMRRRTLSQLTYTPTAPLFLGKNKDGSMLDLESFAVDILEKSLTTKAAEADRSLKERLAYATSLASFAKTDAGQAALARVKTELQAEVKASTDAVKREQLRTLLQTVSK